MSGADPDAGSDALSGEADAVVAGFHGAPTVLLVCESPDLVVRAANAAAVAMLRGRDVIGMPFREAFFNAEGQRLWNLYDEVFRTGETRVLTDWRVHLEAPDGTVFERYADFTVTPWRAPDGGVRGTIAAGFDTTDSVRRRQESEAGYVSAMATVEALQTVLLPEDLPLLPRLELDVSYLLATEESSAGGDWYDAVVRPSGDVFLVVGDVVGHGVGASAVMGQLRAVLHERLLDDGPLVDALDTVDRYARTRLDSLAATVCVVHLEPDTGELCYVTAGHPPPLVVDADGTSAYLPPSGAAPLGTRGGFEARPARLEAGQVLVLYTDGAVERPGRTPQEGGVELATIMGDNVADRAFTMGSDRRPTARACRTGLEMLVRGTGHTDDLTLLAARRRDTPRPLHLALPARTSTVGRVREELGRWLADLDPRSLDLVVLQHSVGELVANAVGHAYADALEEAARPDAVVVDASLETSGEVAVTVRDTGAWRAAEPSAGATPRGRGLAMARGLADHLDVRHDGAGTAAHVRHRLTRPSLVLTAPRLPRPVPDRALTVAERDGVVHVGGPVDVETVERLRMMLDRVSRGGTTPLVVDLSTVTHLGSAGVQLLHERVADTGDVTLVAPVGSVADHVLELVQLPHVFAVPPPR